MGMNVLLQMYKNGQWARCGPRAVAGQAPHPIPQVKRRQSLHQPSSAIPELVKGGMSKWAFSPQGTPPRISYGTGYLSAERDTFILVHRGFEQSKVDLPRDAACGRAGHALSGLQGLKSLPLSAYQLRPWLRMHQLVRCKPFANCSAQRSRFCKLPPRGSAFSSLHEGTSVSINPGNSSSHHQLSPSSPKTFLQQRPAAAARGAHLQKGCKRQKERNPSERCLTQETKLGTIL